MLREEAAHGFRLLFMASLSMENMAYGLRRNKEFGTELGMFRESRSGKRTASVIH